MIRRNKLDLLERLADDLAHEIKNPLHAMVINLEVLKRRIARFGGEHSEEMQRYTAVLDAELDRVNRRVDLLLRMARPARGGEPVTIAEVVDELQDVMELEADRRGITLDCEIEGAAAHLQVPREPARQLILNLILFALESVPDRQSLRVRLEGDMREMRLRFDGAAISEGERLVSAHASGELAAARALSESLGGRVELSAARGNGDPPGRSVLVLTLPSHR